MRVTLCDGESVCCFCGETFSDGFYYLNPGEPLYIFGEVASASIYMSSVVIYISRNGVIFRCLVE